MAAKKALFFPWWVEAALVLLLSVMGFVEIAHGQWAWGLIFAVGGGVFAVSLGTRLLSGEKHEE